ncbi:MAG: SDR family oxidoreductase, partial [Oxalobacteraceae bacterium]
MSLRAARYSWMRRPVVPSWPSTNTLYVMPESPSRTTAKREEYEMPPRPARTAHETFVTVGASRMRPLQDRWALVTGASRGIGQQVAQALAAEGCRLILHSRTLVATAALAERLRKQGATVHTLAAELSESAEVERLAAEVSALCAGPLDILYNNAAVMTPYHASYLTVVPAEYELSFRVNTVAPILLSNHFLPDMLAQG